MKKVRKLAMLAMFGATFMLFSFTQATPENLYGEAVKYEVTNLDASGEVSENFRRRRIRRAFRRAAEGVGAVAGAAVTGAAAAAGQAVIQAGQAAGQAAQEVADVAEAVGEATTTADVIVLAAAAFVEDDYRVKNLGSEEGKLEFIKEMKYNSLD